MEPVSDSQQEFADSFAGMTEVLSGPHSDLESKLMEFSVDNIKAGEFTKEVSDTELTQIVNCRACPYWIQHFRQNGIECYLSNDSKRWCGKRNTAIFFCESILSRRKNTCGPNPPPIYF